MGFVRAAVQDDRADIHAMAGRKGKQQEDVARALVARLHRGLVRRGIKTVSAGYGEPALAALLQPLGYRSELTGGINMFALLNLPQFLDEIAPLLNHRLARKDFSGTIAILGAKHRAGLRIHAGRINALRRPPARPDIALSGSDAAITRIVAGIETPFEAYLQLDLMIAPMLNDATRDLLETLFPRLEVFNWLW